MDDNDRTNLEFLLNVNAEVLDDWYKTVSEDDHIYALELLKAYAEELRIEAKLLEVYNINNFNDANVILKRFML